MAVALERKNFIKKFLDKFNAFFNQSWDVTENQQYSGGVVTGNFDEIAGKTQGVTKAQIEQLKKAMKSGETVEQENNKSNSIVKSASVDERAAQKTMKEKTNIGKEMPKETQIKQIGED